MPERRTITWQRGIEQERVDWFVHKWCVFCIAYPEPADEAVRFYDRWAIENNRDYVEREDVAVANTFQARTPWGKWQPSLGAINQALAQIDVKWGLFDPLPEEIWLQRRMQVQALFEAAMRGGIGYASGTKVLHLKRPNLIPICDSVIVRRLAVQTRGNTYPAVAISCMEELRKIGMSGQNRAVLGEAKNYVAGILGSESAYAHATDVRILDAVLWSDTGERRRYWPLLGWE